MPKTIQQFIDEYDRIKKNINEAEKEEEVIKSQAKKLFAKNKVEDPGYLHAFLMGSQNPTQNEIAVWSKLNIRIVCFLCCKKSKSCFPCK